MKLTVFTPLGTVLKCKINKVNFETLNGYYTLLPKHVDFASAMEANIVSYTTETGAEKYVACHRGIVVKKGDTVTITAQNAVAGETLDELTNVIEREFKQNDEQRKEINSAMARLELGIIRGFGQLNRGDFDGGI
ncbi:MAG: F0F1 ATP synthase subunit epsilon [Alphaproteobacteria bacterium]|nr:F0F1 ATP synthase subunit epsilon [Alphaproteobacteria bacterium]